MVISDRPTPDELATVRKATGMSQSKIAQLAKCSRASVAIAEAGYTPAQSAVMDRIVQVLRNAEPSQPKAAKRGLLSPEEFEVVERALLGLMDDEDGSLAESALRKLRPLAQR